MFSSESAGIDYYLPSQNLSPFNLIQENIPSLHSTSFLTNLPYYQTSPSIYDFSPQSSCISNNSTSDEADDNNQLGMVDERKQRRMISNRESARRSRMRKKRHLDELCSLVSRLRTEKDGIIEQLNNLSERYDKVVQENEQLKEEVSDLRETINEVQFGSPFSGLRDLEEIIPCYTAYLRAETLNQTINPSTNLLQ